MKVRIVQRSTIHATVGFHITVCTLFSFVMEGTIALSASMKMIVVSDMHSALQKIVHYVRCLFSIPKIPETSNREVKVKTMKVKEKEGEGTVVKKKVQIKTKYIICHTSGKIDKGQ